MSICRQLFAGLPLLLLICNATFAAEEAITNRFSGFASIGLVTNDNPDIVFRRDVTQTQGSHDGDIEWRNDSILGLQWQTQWSYQLETTAQFVVKDRLNNSLEESIEWAFVRYRPLDGLDIRLGRLGTDIFMLSDYRQVGYALPWIRPPHDTYGLLSFYHFDGADISKRFNIGDSTLNVKAFYGRSDQEYPVDTGTNSPYRLIFEGGGIGFNWELDEWKLRYSYANVEVKNNNANLLSDALNAVSSIWPEASVLAENFLTRSKNFKYHQLGVAYDNNVWFLQTEATQLNSDAIVISSTRHFYVSLGRRIDAFTFYVARGYVRSVNPPISIIAPSGYPPDISLQLNSLAYASEYALNGARSSQHSVSFGARWDFTSKMDLKLQVDEFKVDKFGDALWIHAQANTIPQAQTAHVVSVSLDVLF